MVKRKKENSVLNSNWLENDLSTSTTLKLSVSSLDDYRHIPLYPTLEDVTKKAPSLCANNVKSPYQSCDKYLDTFFRLMREDFVSNIRDTLKFLKKPNKNEHERLEMQRIWLFTNVKINKTNDRSLKTILIQFDTPRNANKIDYENSKQFKNGSLLMLSKDKFSTFSLGIIMDTSKLNHGIVGIDVIDFKEIITWEYIDILEPSAFYEPYRYVMGVFQDMNETNFPMKNYIVYGIENISYPSYLAGNSTYNINGIEFNILQDNEWPSSEVLQMDINQYEAFKGALTKEFAMIQGPPGTGKTYIGLEIVRTIIENLYCTNKLTNPIMVVCMTNHALDQFLEGIWRITRNIARFGFGTKSDILVNYIPNRSSVHKNACNDIYLKAKHGISDSLLKEKVHLFNIKEVNGNKGILDLTVLMEVLIHEGFDKWFQDSYDLLTWLFFDIPHVDGANPINYLKKKLTNLIKSNIDQIEDQLYCLTLDDIKLNCQKLQHQLNHLNETFDPENDDISKKLDLECTLKVIKIMKNYVVDHLKFFNSNNFYEVNNLVDRNSLDGKERWLLYYSWVHLFLKFEKINVENVNEITRQCRRDVNKLNSIEYLKPVKNKYVIGMTTTAAAKNRYLLKSLKCPIVIIEEAAEVLEPHIVASLSEHSKHLILIGDHKQLRPQTANHIMGKKYQLDVSLFERMVNNEIPSYVLAEQHRMRPEIAGLVAPAIYKHLRNHPSVMNRPDVRGVDANVFCITHINYENKDYELSSFKNIVEAKFLVALANYLLKQGYGTQDITIMAMYNAQVLYITKLIQSFPSEQLKDIRVTSVDGYQGEENEIILLSLVRSNDNKGIGFLKTNNRVCVALSRARLGFYIAGNLNLLAKASNLWKSVKDYLCSINALGPNLTLKCENHKLVLGNVSNSLDFKKLTGCKLKCNSKLSCGHLCIRQCHSDDKKHLLVKCLNDCKKKCYRGHTCPKKCYENCNACEVIVSKIDDFGHTIKGKCCIIENIKCQIEVQVFFKCGHSLKKKCYEPSICNQLCNRLNQNCLFRHPCKKLCGEPCGPCEYSIPTVMECGRISNFLCFQVPDLVVCAKKNHLLPCGHEEEVSCSDAAKFHNKTDLKCEKLVPTTHLFICNHQKQLNVPCYIVFDKSKKSLKKWCKKYTALRLECGHKSYVMCDECAATNKKHTCKKCRKKENKLKKLNA